MQRRKLRREQLRRKRPIAQGHQRRRGSVVVSSETTFLFQLTKSFMRSAFHCVASVSCFGSWHAPLRRVSVEILITATVSLSYLFFVYTIFSLFSRTSFGNLCFKLYYKESRIYAHSVFFPQREKVPSEMHTNDTHNATVRTTQTLPKCVLRSDSTQKHLLRSHLHRAFFSFSCSHSLSIHSL